MKRFGLLGEKLSHSYSPQIHAMLGGYEYGLYEMPREKLKEFFGGFSLDGINVTIPHKRDVMSFCDTVSDTARRTGSVNTIVNRGGRLAGHNTDYYGFLWMLKLCKADVRRAKVLVLGSGGASLTVRTVLGDLGASEIVVISRSGSDNYENLKKHEDADIIVNTTPVGMYPSTGIAPVSLGEFPRCRAVLDLIYNPARTRLLLDAEELKIPHTDGLSMLVAQAVKSAELFLDTEIPDGRIVEITNRMRSSMGNIILIGMPGCGKSTIGKITAELTNKTFVDSDEEIERSEGKPIPDIFKEHGEGYFRKAETEVLRRLGKMSGAVIATGGGCVTRQENYSLLHQNGTIIWIKRDIKLLPAQNRPLSERNGAEALYESRRELYRAFADYIVENDNDPRETAGKISEMFL